MWSAARSMAPRATKYERASSTFVSVRSVSARTLFATASPTADSAAVSQSTISRAEPFRERLPLWLIGIIRPRRPVHVEWNRYRADAQIRRCRIDIGRERGHLDP